MHQMVIGSHECFETFLTDFGGYFYFRIRLFEFVYFFQALFLVHLFETGAVGIRKVFHLLYFRIDGYTVLEGEAFFADITVPAYGETVVQGIIDCLDHFVERQVIHELMFPVVRYFDVEFYIIRMMGEARQFDVIVHTQTQRFGKCLGSIFFPFVSECCRKLSQVGIEQVLYQLVVFRAAFLIFYRNISDSFHILSHFAVIVAFGIVVDPFVNLFGNDSYLTVCIFKSMCQTALSDISFATSQVIVL